MTGDTLTVIRSRHLRLAKTIHAHGRIDDYDRAKTIDLYSMPVPDLDAIHALLRRLLGRPSCAVVFGGIADLTRTRAVRRLAYDDPKTGDPATLQPVAHRWCAIDMDSVDRPDDVPASDLALCASLAIERLPEPFHGARCIAQATATHGIKPGCRLRLWYSLGRPTTGDELGYWLKGRSDPCTFRTAQPIYTAAPVFVGRPDHLPQRLVVLDGAATVSVPAPALLKPPPRLASDPRTPATMSGDDVQAFIDHTIDRVRRATDTQKHHTLRDCARLLGGIQRSVGFSDSEAVRWLLDALPASVIDWERARKTAEWGLDVGRAAPIDLPARHRQDTPPDPRRKVIASSAFRLLRKGLPSDAIISELHRINELQRPPLPSADIAATAIWAARRMKEQADAR
jgi:hypothetical protein